MIYIGLMASFLAYSIYIYITPIHPILSQSFKEGKGIWQKENCQACHQIYGLGGYLGPDLSLFAKTPASKMRLKGIIKQGRGVMPNFYLNDQEIEQIWHFLFETAHQSPPQPYSTQP